jgi:hypothetical protein
LPEIELLKPVSDLLHRGSALGLSSLTPAVGESIPNRYCVGVEAGTCSQLGKCQSRQRLGMGKRWVACSIITWGRAASRASADLVISFAETS